MDDKILDYGCLRTYILTYPYLNTSTHYYSFSSFWLGGGLENSIGIAAVALLHRAPSVCRCWKHRPLQAEIWAESSTLASLWIQPYLLRKSLGFDLQGYISTFSRGVWIHTPTEVRMVPVWFVSTSQWFFIGTEQMAWANGCAGPTVRGLTLLYAAYYHHACSLEPCWTSKLGIFDILGFYSFRD